MPITSTITTGPRGTRYGLVHCAGSLGVADAAGFEQSYLTGGPLHRLPLLILIDRGVKLSPDFRAHFSRKGMVAEMPACAMVVPNTGLRVLVSFILKIAQKVNPSTERPPTELFGEEGTALEWLESRIAA
jgi:hypothetical protein